MSERSIHLARGFTMIELVAVIVIVAILAILVVPRGVTNASLTLNARAEQLASDIRYVQALAMTGGQRYCLTLTPSSPYSGYTMTTGASNCVTATPHPAGFTQPVSICSSATCLTAPALTNNYLQFDTLGQPYIAPTTALSSNAVITLTDAGASQTITVAPVTGRVSVP